MRDPAATRAFLASEIESLEPLDFVGVVPSGEPLHAIEVSRDADGQIQLTIPGRPPMLPEIPVAVRSALRERGFASEDAADRGHPWSRSAGDAKEAAGLVERVFGEVFEHPADGALDFLHGSHRAEYEARQKLVEIRTRLEKQLGEIVGGDLERDRDGDYVLPVRDVHVTVAPRAIPNGPVVVRVFAVTNVGVNVTPDLGLLLARLNFGLMFGRFAMDAEHRSIWFDETLLGDHFDEEELRFAIDVVASTADEWDDRLKQMFGGATYQEVRTRSSQHDIPTVKPGTGGYL